MNYKDTHFMISKKLRHLVERGEKSFILYPFGVNGVMTKEILREQFGLEPSCIIDNNLCKTNPTIHPAEFLDSLPSQGHLVLLTIENPESATTIRESVYNHFPKERIVELFKNIPSSQDFRVPWLRHFSRFVYEKKLQGNVAECGVFRGDYAQYINLYFPDRKCYLFDSFEGFRAKDIADDNIMDNIDARPARKDFFENIDDYKATNIGQVMSKMPYPDNIILKQGYVPETLQGIEDSFCFVNLDMDLYTPMLEALRFFYPRIVADGVLLLHDYYSRGSLTGVEKAVYAYEEELGEPLCKLPSEISSSLVIIKR